MKWHTEVRKIEDLKKWEENPRSISEVEYVKLKKSITKRGFHDILKIDEKNVVLSGNQRLDALKELGYKEVECKVADKILTQEEKDAVALESNIQGGEWDMDKLAEGFEDILEELGADDLMPEEVLDIEEDDYEEPKDLETTVVLGDVYQLGEHRLVCGDSTKIEDVEKLMNGEKADMVFTDPPYNVDYGGSQNPIWGKGDKTIANDNMTRDEFLIFLEDSIANMIISTSGALYICMNAKEWGTVRKAFENKGGHWSSDIIWVKDRIVPGRKDYHSRYEAIMYGWADKGKRTWNGERLQNDVWEIKRNSKNDLHPTMKPIELCAMGIENSSNRDSIVLDLFGGSGSTLIACEQTNRKCYMMEISPHYCQVIIDRWEKLTNMEAKKL